MSPVHVTEANLFGTSFIILSQAKITMISH
uniref:Uncharacterized protein n=1 Tax=Arundo donax TaxID=35708 RepID=A0A0A9A9W1_ARUDO